MIEEECVLGALLVEPRVIFERASFIQPCHLIDDRHKLIYEAVLDLGKEGKEINLISVTEYLEQKDRLQQAGGAAYLSRLVAEALPSLAPASAREIFKKAALRKKLLAYEQLGECLKNGRDPEKEAHFIEILMNSELTETSERISLPLISSNELLSGSTTKAVSWVVEDLIPSGSVVLISAPPAHYKTWVALALSKSVAEGTPFLGKSTEQRPVVYIDRENPEALIGQRLKKIGSSHAFYFWPLWTRPEPPVIGNALFNLIPKQYPAPLIVFDSFIRFLPAKLDENSSTDMSPVMGAIRKLTIMGASVLILHHKGKGEGAEYRGSSEILAGVDVAFTLSRAEVDEETTRLILKGIKNRFRPELSLEIKVGDEGDVFVFSNITGEKDREDLGALEELIGRMVKGSELPNQKQVIAEAGAKLEMPKQRALRLLRMGENKKWAVTRGQRNQALYRPIQV